MSPNSKATRAPERTLPTETPFKDVYEAVKGRSEAIIAIRMHWFFASLGVISVLDNVTEVTRYLSKAANAYYFADLDVVPWTNWLGSLYVRLKEATPPEAVPPGLGVRPSK